MNQACTIAKILNKNRHYNFLWKNQLFDVMVVEIYSIILTLTRKQHLKMAFEQETTTYIRIASMTIRRNKV